MHEPRIKEEKTMGLVKRQAGDRRWGMVVEFPLTDFQGTYVLHDRRSGTERRCASLKPEDLLTLLSHFHSGKNSRK
jgi:hypothetical protein